MTSTSWDPALYNRYADERGRPFHDLVGRIPTPDPRDVTDLGCGPGTMTATLLSRWPRASVEGIDSSPGMISSAAAFEGPRLRFRLGAIQDWDPAPDSVDVIVANASLQWVPGHAALLPTWAAALRPGGALAFQQPVPAGAAAFEVFASVVSRPRWSSRLGSVGGPRSAGNPVRPIGEYADTLARLGLLVDAWQTTYLHILPGEDPVLAWFSGTGLRPYLDELAGDPAALADFRAEVAAGLREAYPAAPYGTVMSFERLFVVATRA